MIGASVLIGGGGIGATVCYRCAGEMVETEGKGKVVTCAAKGVSCTGVRTDGSEITETALTAKPNNTNSKMSPKSLYNSSSTQSRRSKAHSYEFLLANKKCRVDAEVFRKILDICPRVEAEEFNELENNGDTLTFLINLGYKGPLHKIGEDYQEYGHDIPNVMLNNAIKQSESYQMFIKYSTGQIPPPPQKSRGKGLQGKKTIDDSHETVDVYEEYIALELGKSISLAKAKEEEAAKQVHATHARIMIESVPESAKKKTGSKSSKSVVIQDTPSAPKPKPVISKPKLKGVHSLNPNELEAVDIMQALKESKKTNKRQLGTGGSSEGTDTIPGVPDESKVVFATLNEGTEEEQLNDKEKDDKEGDADDEGNDHISDTQDTNNKDDETEYDEDKIYKYKIRGRKDKDVEMTNT
nr:hypothetical protein [Tanacetum cinerariifolium]